MKTESEIHKILDMFEEQSVVEGLDYLNFFTLLVKREHSFAKNLIFITENEGFNELFIWTPKAFQKDVFSHLKEIHSNDIHFTNPTINEVQYDHITPPTFIKTNSFTYAF